VEGLVWPVVGVTVVACLFGFFVALHDHRTGRRSQAAVLAGCAAAAVSVVTLLAGLPAAVALAIPTAVYVVAHLRLARAFARQRHA